MAKPTVAVYKFSSCDGCQLAFLNAGEALLELTQQVDIVHFAEAGPLQEDTQADIAFVEGSINTAHDLERVQAVRANSRFLITIGACATAGGIQALRNMHTQDGWHEAIYAHPEYLDSLDQVTPIRDHVKVDYEIWGCPVNTQQVMQAVSTLIQGARPTQSQETVCMECKKRGNICVAVAQGKNCLGPHTHAGCGSICPAFGRGCYGCYGPQGLIYGGA